MSGAWDGLATLFAIGLFCAFSNAARLMSDGVRRRKAYFNAVLYAAIFAAFGYATYGTRTIGDSDPIFGGGEVVEDEDAKPELRFSGSVKVFVICFGCFAYGVYKSKPPSATVSRQRDGLD